MECNKCSKFLICDRKTCEFRKIRYLKVRRVPKMIYDIEEQIQDLFR